MIQEGSFVEVNDIQGIRLRVTALTGNMARLSDVNDPDFYLWIRVSRIRELPEDQPIEGKESASK